MQADIEQAKKDWELSHLQSLREQEERIAREEEEEEAMFLTYDRPEMVNKVVFRRRPSTGTWEVCPPSEVSRSDSKTAINEASTKPKQQRFQDQAQSSRKPSSRVHPERELKVHIALQQASLSDSSGLGKLPKRSVPQKAEMPGRHAAHAACDDPDYKPGAKGKRTGKRPKLRGEIGDSDAVSHDGAYVSSNIQKAVSPVSLVNSYPQTVNHMDTNSISTRTRLRQTHSSPLGINHGKLGSSPHRYPTRSKQ